MNIRQTRRSKEDRWIKDWRKRWDVKGHQYPLPGWKKRCKVCSGCGHVGVMHKNTEQIVTRDQMTGDPKKIRGMVQHDDGYFHPCYKCVRGSLTQCQTVLDMATGKVLFRKLTHVPIENVTGDDGSKVAPGRDHNEVPVQGRGILQRIREALRLPRKRSAT